MAKSDYIRLINWRTSFNYVDIHPVYRDVVARESLIEAMCAEIRPFSPDVICGIEAQGYILATAVALKLGLPLVLIEKCFSGPALPSYTLEIRDFSRKWKRFSLRKNAVNAGDRCVIVDDWIETGSQMQCAMDLLAQARASVVAVAVLHADYYGVSPWLRSERRLIAMDDL